MPQEHPVNEASKTEPTSEAGSALPADADSSIYRNVMDTVASGVMSLDTEGRVTLFNTKASKITGLPQASVRGQLLAEILSQMEGADEFTDVILDAIYDMAVGQQRLVEVNLQGVRRTLSIETSYLMKERDGERVRAGVVVVFNDVSELQSLRKKELQLAKEVETKHTALQKAYRALEDGNEALQSALKKGQYMAAGSALIVVTMLLVIVFWGGGDAPGTVPVEAFAQEWTADVGQRSTLVVEPQRITTTVTVPGRLVPRREVEVTSPIDGKVTELHFQFGDQVAKGQKLVALDVREMEIEYREAQAAHIKARERVAELEDWSNHVEVSRARRAVSQARIGLEASRNRLDSSTLLLEQGFIPAFEYEAAQREYDSQQLLLESAEQDMETLLAQGVQEAEIARLELSNAQARLSSLEEIIRDALVRSPVSGIALALDSGQGAAAGEEQARNLALGAFVKRGDHLLTVGDLGGFAVVGHVDEVDVVKIRVGAPATITSDAFPGVVLAGEIVRVSPQTIGLSGGTGMPRFGVTAVVEQLNETQRQALRLGMSVQLVVVVDNRPDALLVPIGAIEVHDGQSWLYLKDPDSGEPRAVRVTTGATTLDSVEIVAGLEAGSEVLVRSR